MDDHPYAPPAPKPPDPTAPAGWKQWWMALDWWQQGLLLSGAWLALVGIGVGVILIVQGPLSDARADAVAKIAGIGVGICIAGMTPRRKRRVR
jgi:hypothetical protein